MSSEVRIPDNNALNAARMVSDRIVAAIAYPLLRAKVRHFHPAAAEVVAVLQERSPGYFVFAEVHALDEHGAALGEVPFLAHVLAPEGYAPIDGVFSDADAVRAAAHGDGEYRVSLAFDEVGGLGMPDLVEVMPPWLRRQLFDLLLQYQRP